MTHDMLLTYSILISDLCLSFCDVSNNCLVLPMLWRMCLKNNWELSGAVNFFR